MTITKFTKLSLLTSNNQMAKQPRNPPVGLQRIQAPEDESQPALALYLAFCFTPTTCCVLVGRCVLFVVCILHIFVIAINDSY